MYCMVVHPGCTGGMGKALNVHAELDLHVSA